MKVGLIAVDGTKMHANASHHNNLDYERLAGAILAEAERIDSEEDELYGDARGDELPEQLRTAEGRRAALKEAKAKLERSRQHQARPMPSTTRPLRRSRCRWASSWIPQRSSPTAAAARDGCGRRAISSTSIAAPGQANPALTAKATHRVRAPHAPRPAGRTAANDAYEHYRAQGRMKDGRALRKPTEALSAAAGAERAYQHDRSRLTQHADGERLGAGIQRAGGRQREPDRARGRDRGPLADFGHLEAIAQATESELEKIGIAEKPKVMLADAGYWHQKQMEKIVSRGIQVLIPPDADRRKGGKPRKGWTGGFYEFMRRVLPSEHGASLYRKRQAMVEPVFGDVKFNRKIDRFHRRGRSAVRAEWRLATASHNLLKLHRHQLAAAMA